MRYRQVHLDFHTSERIPGIGSRFKKAQFQEALRVGHVDSITVFAKCHHGWSYHPTAVGERHPNLDFDLLRTMIEAAHEIGVRTPVYISAGLDERQARLHPEWLWRNPTQGTQWARGFLEPGYHELCMNTPYLDFLLEQVDEVVRNYDADGIFLDIVGERQCYCIHCLNALQEEGADPADAEAHERLGARVYRRYAEAVNERIRSIKPDMPIFHNGGHIRRGRRELARLNSHLELESLPTGGWGYDHFPLSARYVAGLEMPYLGMTGKFHTTWGEFGGFKHPNALRYEVALSLAHGARCSIGDQMHPSGEMDMATYALIGEAYAQAEALEPWCRDAKNVADVGVLSVEAVGAYYDRTAEKGVVKAADRSSRADSGAVRILTEGKILFDVLDTESDFSAYRVLVLPDEIVLDAYLAGKVRAFAAGGGRVLATGRSGLDVHEGAFALRLGVRHIGERLTAPDYLRLRSPLPGLRESAYVIYADGQCVESTEGSTVLARRENAYFNRKAFQFSSHQHTPNTLEDAGPAVVQGEEGIYVAWAMFGEYATKGSLIAREVILDALRRLLPDPAVRVSLPAQGVTTVSFQEKENRMIHHLLYASPVRRGEGIEVIEDLIPVLDVEVELRVPFAARNVYLAPQGTKLPFTQQDGVVKYRVPRIDGHQVAAIEP